MRVDRLLLGMPGPSVAFQLREVLPSLREQFVSFAALRHDKDFPAANNMSNLRNRNPGNASRNTPSAWHGKEQFIVFSAVQSEVQINFIGWFSNGGPRN